MDKFNCGVYTIETPLKDLYIGSSINISKRKYEHFRLLKNNEHTNKRLQEAWNTFGDSLVYKQILVCRPEDLTFFEQQIIDHFHPNLNLVHQVERPMLGRIVSLETRERIRQSRLGKKASEETKQKMREANKNKLISDETRKKIGLANTGKIRTQEVKDRISKTKTGISGAKHTEETKNYLRLINIGRKHLPETILKMKLLATQRYREAA